MKEIIIKWSPLKLVCSGLILAIIALIIFGIVLEIKNYNLQSDLIDTEDLNTELDAQLVITTNSLSEMTNLHNTDVNLITELKSQLDDKKEENINNQRTLNNEISLLNAKLADKDKTLRIKQEEINELKERIDDLKEEIDDLEEDC